MIVRVRNIPEDGLDAAFSISPKVIQKGFPKTDSAATSFDHEISCDLHLSLNEDNVFVYGRARTMLRPVCDRCSEAYDHTFDIELQITCSPGKAPKGADIRQESDEGLVYYHHNEIDLAELVREQLILSLPMKFLCKPDCRGLCSVCGANLNQGEHKCLKAVRH